MSKLVIVESPAKAKTIQKYLGKDYTVIASMGHIRDLPKSTMGVDLENRFKPKYINIKGKEALIRELKSAAKDSDTVYLATDPDREGEAISWHLAHLLSIDPKEPNRVTFNEITKTGVKNGMAHPRSIDQNLVDAQQARRILDRIVGYKLSPFLWKKVKSGLSAGRVQSVAVRLIVDREEEIRVFQVEEYWTIDAMLLPQGARKPFAAKLHSFQGKKLDTVKTREEAEGIVADLGAYPFMVASVKKGVRKKSPAPPFTTSTLQQDASRKLGFQARRTMKAAQELYEGVEVEGQGAIGLITYMRTDSLRLSEEAMDAAEAFIRGRYGENYLPAQRRVYKSKKGAQDGHEAIRPSVPSITPEEVKSSLTSDQYKLYKLIWERFIASQMGNCLLDTVSVDISAGEYLFKASGYTVKFPGYTVLYEQSSDDEEEKSEVLPELHENDPLIPAALTPNQHFTQPPARYTEASLIKTLEENGIGRPSTYAPTITTILARNYVEREGRQIRPTILGEVITKLMCDQFQNIVDADFTARMEQQLDDVEDGKTDWVSTLDSFYQDFSQTLENAEKNMDGTRIKIPDEETDIVCEKCGRNMVVKTGRFGKFLACPGYPDCKNTKKIVKETGGICPECGAKVLEKKSKSGKIFFGCESYPNCTFTTWDTPISDLCPQCGSTLFRKKGRAGKIYCLKPGCGYEQGPATPAERAAEAPEPMMDVDMPETASKKSSAAKKKPAAKTAAKKPAAKTAASKTAKAKAAKESVKKEPAKKRVAGETKKKPAASAKNHES
ncbi:MAG: type I DNA topoisomerase [Provencibacterium sp.]|jgi:DNA topoisomerase-1|nr:type I DNA topoisomerase [Provencibacterium sp.]